MELVIKNCNCIKKATIEVLPNTLNIKYGTNGTGKTTISEAIFAEATGDSQKLAELLPYGANAEKSEELPNVEGMTFSKVRVFDDNYINSYLFKGDNFFDDSFQVFLKSDKCDELSMQIETLLSDLQGVFQSSEEIQALRTILPEYFNAVKYADGSISKKGGVGEFIKGNGSGFENYIELDAYKPFYTGREMSKVSKWAKWRNDGIKEMQGDCCPFCTKGLDETINKQNTTIAKVFKNSALSTANAVLDYLKKASDMNYIKNDAIGVLEGYIGNANKSDDLLAELQQLAIETDYLYKKIEKICSFRPMNVTHEQLLDIEANLDNMYIEERQLSKFYGTELILHMVQQVAEKINNLKENTGKLKGLFLQHEAKLKNIIQERKDDINQFFALAGFPYQFGLEQDGEKKAVAYLIPSDDSIKSVKEPGKHLSWGEKNAFALVMFMFETISVDADLIVLDDPISSFDKHKKFAVIRRMFDNQKASFRDKTVMMLTHDMQPIIDYVHGGFFNLYGLTTPVSAKMLQNVNGEINEDEIVSDDLINTVELTLQIAKDCNQKTLVRIVNLRKYVELTYPSFKTTSIYDILSNLIHGRPIAQNKDGVKLDENLFLSGCDELKKYIPDKEYDAIINELSVNNLIQMLDNSGTYEKVLSIRLLFERKEGMLSLLKKKYPDACKFINETNHIENDYVFQLNPFKFFDIPQYYIEQIKKFINEEKKSFMQG